MNLSFFKEKPTVQYLSGKGKEKSLYEVVFVRDGVKLITIYGETYKQVKIRLAETVDEFDKGPAESWCIKSIKRT